MVRETPQAESTEYLMMEAALVAMRRAAEFTPTDPVIWSAYVAALLETGQKS